LHGTLCVQFEIWNEKFGMDGIAPSAPTCFVGWEIGLDTPQYSSHFCDVMKTATVRDLRYDFPKIEAWIAGGDEILITKHAKPVARIMSPAVSAGKRGSRHPDYEARLRRIWGDRVFTQEEVDEMRAFETGEP